MRVLHVVRQFYPAVGGLEGVVHALSVQQRRSGLDADVLTLDREFRDPSDWLPERDLVDGVPVRRIGYLGSKRYPIAPAVLGHLKPYDLIHVHGVDFFCDYLALLAPVHRKPLVLSTHGGFFHTGFAQGAKRVYFRTVTRAALGRYKRVFACSAADAETFRPVAGDRLKQIDNGVDIAKFAGASSPVLKPSLACFGRIASHKGLERLLDTFEILKTRLPAVELQLIGNDSDGTLARLQTKYDRLLREGSVKIKTGLDDDAIARSLRDCSFFVSASEYEGFGLALVEALSAGLVPIVNRIPTFEKIVADAGVGHLADFGDPGQAADVIASAIADAAERYDALRAQAMASVTRYGWEETEQRFRGEYERILGLKRRTILGVAFEPMRRAEAVEKIDGELERGREIKVAFANAHTLTLAKQDNAFRRALSNFLVLNDGVGVDIASRLKFGRPFPENLNGTDFVPYYLSRTQHRLRIFLVGARPDVVSEAARRFAVTWPQHQIIGTCGGYFRDEKQVDELCRIIRSVKADLLLVGLGNPMQELWIANRGISTGARLQMGVGALFDFTAGRVPRAPPWVRRLRCEWVYRLTREPRRLFSRYILGGFVFMRHVLGDRHTGLAP
ncbi:WecB/TagA/CpsF family glycosyltransferase [Hyphomicrobium sp.]|uniref:WecB/TagA/CpsF family glycosyltransferase n=1 Tax=Hyphomicrobium sp. TaxID=82 RepID=UPI0025B9C5A9|nr:WecB/TagA/CpsF family glycosyltransferase [Hyphomicrobium sp.]MCC7251281.1 WecB/TagA/CpsF family glycosyltransferase [Hyphomicrobium sp.]